MKLPRIPTPAWGNGWLPRIALAAGIVVNARNAVTALPEHPVWASVSWVCAGLLVGLMVSNYFIHRLLRSSNEMFEIMQRQHDLLRAVHEAKGDEIAKAITKQLKEDGIEGTIQIMGLNPPVTRH